MRTNINLAPEFSPARQGTDKGDAYGVHANQIDDTGIAAASAAFNARSLEEARNRSAPA